MKIKLSYECWQKIGNESGWIKKSAIDEEAIRLQKEEARKNSDEYAIFCPNCGKENPDIVKADIGVGGPTDKRMRNVTQCCGSEQVEDKRGFPKPVPQPEIIERENNQITSKMKSNVKILKSFTVKSAKTPNKLPSQMDVYKTVRKPISPPTKIMDDGMGKHKRMKDFGGEDDSATLEDLVKEAHEVTRIKGHLLGNWDVTNNHGLRSAIASCITCGKAIFVNEAPRSNEEMSGNAMFEECSSKEDDAEIKTLQSKIQDAFLKNSIREPK